MLADNGVNFITHVPSWILAALVMAVALGWWILEYALKLKRQLDSMEGEILSLKQQLATAKAEGVREGLEMVKKECIKRACQAALAGHRDEQVFDSLAEWIREHLTNAGQEKEG